MATVAELVRGGEGRQKFIDYTSTYRDNNKEFLRGDMWEFKFLNAPKIVYYPGDDIINARLNSVNVGIDYSVNGFEKRMRNNFVLYQQTGQNTSGTLTLGFVDREDQAITYFIDDWRQKIADRDTKYSFRKDDLVGDCQLILTNSSRIDVRTLTFYNVIIADGTVDENGQQDDGTDRADIQLSLKYEHYSANYLIINELQALLLMIVISFDNILNCWKIRK